jgi:hypothetical protein
VKEIVVDVLSAMKVKVSDVQSLLVTGAAV